MMTSSWIFCIALTIGSDPYQDQLNDVEKLFQGITLWKQLSEELTPIVKDLERKVGVHHPDDPPLALRVRLLEIQHAHVKMKLAKQPWLKDFANEFESGYRKIIAFEKRVADLEKLLEIKPAAGQTLGTRMIEFRARATLEWTIRILENEKK